MKKPIVKYISLKSIYQMNPPQFVLDMLQRIESRGDTQAKTNNTGESVVLYGITDGERKIIDLFKGGNLNPRSYGPKNEGLNLSKKPIDSGPLGGIPKHGNKSVTQHFFSDQINSRIVKWGTTNLKIEKFNSGWGLMNYKTMLAFRKRNGEMFVNNQRYSPSTSKIQHEVKYQAQRFHEGPVQFVSEEEIYIIAGVENQTQDYPWRGRFNEEVTDRKVHIKNILKTL